MKLEFLKKPMEYLCPVLRETRQLEETAEAIIPDSCPDIQEMLITCGSGFLRGKDVGEGSLTVSVGVSASAMAQPEGRDTPEVVEVYIPMSLKLENSVLHTGQAVRAEVTLQRLDSHLVNPRKVMVRATVSVNLWVYEKRREDHLDTPMDKSIQLFRKTAPIRCLKSLGEKNYTVEDQLNLGLDGVNNRLCGAKASLRHTDMHLAGERAILKGEANVEVLYLTEGGKLRTGSGTVAFSQYIDVEDCGEGAQLRVLTALTGMEVNLSGSGANVILQLCSTAEVWRTEELSYIGDMYCLNGFVTAETENRCYDSLIDRQIFAPVAQESVDGVQGQPIYACCTLGETITERNGENVHLTLPVSVQLLYEADSGRLGTAGLRAELKMTTTAAPDCRFEVYVEDLNVSTGTMGALSAKVSGTVTVQTCCGLSITEITGGTLTDDQQKGDVPGLVIRRPAAGETMWDIAKRYQTTMEAILQANGIEGKEMPDKMLLIPRAR